MAIIDTNRSSHQKLDNFRIGSKRYASDKEFSLVNNAINELNLAKTAKSQKEYLFKLSEAMRIIRMLGQSHI